MELVLLVIVLIMLAISLSGIAVLWRRHYVATKRAGTRATRAPATIHMETSSQDGTTVADLPPESEPQVDPWYARFNRRPLLSNALIALLIVIIGIGGWLIYNNLTVRSSDRFVVLIAPFDDGGDGQTGRNIADALARLLSERSNGGLTAVVLEERPTDPQTALQLANTEGGDLLVYGSVDPGAMLDSSSLHPRLIYTPNGPYAPNAWDGYLSRFAMPRSYSLANEAINGQAVLAPLLLTLYDYGRGKTDVAYVNLERLINDYPQLNAALPQALRGNILWARGSYPEAAEAYRMAMAQPGDEPALLANNLGAILFDSGDSGVLSAFTEAVRLLEGHDLGELRYNLGLLALRDSRAGAAAVELEQARNLMPANTPLLLTLTAAYRESGRLDAATETLAAAEGQAGLDGTLVPPDLRVMFNQRSNAAIREQRGLLGLTRETAAQGPLTWELEVSAPLPRDTARSLRNDLQIAVDTSELEVAKWRQRSASEGASIPGTGLIATGQAERAEINANRQRYVLALLETEVARTERQRPRSTLGSTLNALFSTGNSSSAGTRLFTDLNQRIPNNPAIMIAMARNMRVTGQLNDADRTYDLLLQLVPQQPEAYFGKGMVALGRGDSDTAAQLFNSSIEHNSAFFPARIELASIAQSRGDYQAAIAQLRTLAQQRPGAPSAVALAQALRLSGAQAYSEAEEILRPFSTTDAAAAIELGRLYNQAGHPQESINAYKDALTIDPRSSTASFELGERLAEADDLDGAERSLRQAISFDENNIDARLALARLYEGPLNDPGRADREYAVALKQGIDNVDQLIAIGNAAMANDNPEQAITAYNRAISLDSNSATAHYKLGRAYLATNRLQMANDQFLRVLELTVDTPDPDLRTIRAETLVSLGDISRKQGDLLGASGYYNQALTINPGLISAIIGLGQVEIGQNQWGVALGYFEQATRAPGGSEIPEAQFWLGEGRLHNGDLAGATTAYQQALTLRSTFPEALLGMAQTQYAQGDRSGALQTVNRSLAQRSSYAEALLFKGKLLQEQGNFTEALDAYDASIRANGRIPETRFRRAMIYISNETYDRAIDDLRQAVELQPNFPEAHYWLGRAYYAQNRTASALDEFNRATQLNGGFLEALFYSGLAAEDLGRRDEAVNAYQSVSLADPNGEWGDRARAQIDRLQ